MVLFTLPLVMMNTETELVCIKVCVDLQVSKG